ncbi:hypothetical protein B9L20_27210 [Serratia marcescens]|nr:hypothetical protein AN699_0224580 [Serratia marcescens]OCN30807.1 hypothetical protein AN701_0228180 [Serratia marcescens]OCN34462.1 hypothetical protein AN658_0224695 [Serratia marcescens]OCN51613.1 hypothetical protein AN660_0228080 [Serratia marcescens]OCN55580.1 hypothetical protein AN664_0224900 [Serratia marcescens]
MNSKYRSVIALFYLCSSLFIVLFIMAVLFSLLGYWVGGGENILSFFIAKLFTYFKIALVGILIGLPVWFFYYRDL